MCLRELLIFFSGLIIYVDLTTPITEEASESYLNYVESAIADTAGVSVDEVTIDTTYQNTGIINITSEPENIDQFLIELQTAMANELNVDPETIEIDYDEATGQVTYTVNSETYAESASLEETLSSNLPSLSLLTFHNHILLTKASQKCTDTDCIYHIPIKFQILNFSGKKLCFSNLPESFY
jgi:hypothetical protein